MIFFFLDMEYWTHHYTLVMVLEGVWELAQPFHICFVNLEKAYDCVPQGVLWMVLQGRGIDGHSIFVLLESELGSQGQEQIRSVPSQGWSPPTLLFITGSVHDFYEQNFIGTAKRWRKSSSVASGFRLFYLHMT